MKKALFLLLPCLSLPLFALAALSPEQVRQAYANCVNYLSLPADEREAVAEESGYDRETIDRSCREVRAAGIQRMLENERRVRAAENAARNYQSQPHKHFPYNGGYSGCSYSNQCGIGSRCVSGRCVPLSRAPCHKPLPGGGCDTGTLITR